MILPQYCHKKRVESHKNHISTLYNLRATSAILTVAHWNHRPENSVLSLCKGLTEGTSASAMKT